MMKKIICIIAIIFLMVPGVARADSLAPEIVDTTLPVSPEIKAAILTELTVNPPVTSTSFYAITYISEYEGGWAVSVAALAADKSEGWSLERGDFVWMGTLFVSPGFEEAEYLANPAPIGTAKLASPSMLPGGGPEIVWPWERAHGVMYGPRGVHDAGYGTSGMYAIDSVVGDDLGTNIASAMAYAAAPGSIDYVCADENSVAVRTYDLETANYFIYAHLLPNANLIYGYDLARGDAIGSLKFGSFSHEGEGVDCGWADQKANHAHLHWGFTPLNGRFQVENCIITVSNDEITCGTNTIHVGGVILGGGGTAGLDDPYANPNNPWSKAYGDQATFFDLLTIGISDMVSSGISQALPAHNSSMGDFAAMTSKAAEVVFRLAFTMFRGQLDLTPLIGVAAFWLGVWSLWGVIRGILLIFQAVRLFLLR